jgi:tRNA(fMet)-specific endonuclease VapC
VQFLLDTDTCIHALKTLNPHLIARLENHTGQVATSTIVMHELYYGAAGYAEPQKRLFLIDQIALQLEILPFNRASALMAGNLRSALRKSGPQIGPYDILIAATALVHELVLVTGNIREFSRVPDLRLENWLA